jgi:hypothetical protein
VANGEESAPRFEGELTYSNTFGPAAITAWLGALTQESESRTTNASVDSTGISYGVQAKVAGLTVHASGYDGEGLNVLVGPIGAAGTDNIDSNGYLLQGSYAFGPSKFVLSYGQSELEGASNLEVESIVGAYFHSINSNLKLVAEYDVHEITEGAATEDVDTIALGAILNF